MKPRHFHRRLEDAEIVRAIAATERKTSGQIRVYISHKKIADALARAQMRFAQLGMSRTRDRNAVLIYVAPHARKFAVIGDTAIHEKCGDPFWQTITAQMTADLQRGDPTAAIVRAVQTIGTLLAAHFPCIQNQPDELPNAVERD